MIQYLHFFFGHRVRAIISSIVLGALAITVVFFPHAITKVISNLLGAILTGIVMAIGPLMQPLLTLIIIGIGFGIMMRGFRGSGKKK
ncbi:MAG: hypothetical protein WCW14_00530 [Candidatus Paceibacterota bacterium]